MTVYYIDVIRNDNHKTRGGAAIRTREVAKLAGISVRTLQYYDSVGLLRPGRSENGYRNYSPGELDRLQQILLFRQCGFPLDRIKKMIDSPSFDRVSAFALQKKLLEHQKARIDAMLVTLERSIRSMKGGIMMSAEEQFSGFDFSSNPYEEEARRLWGDAAVRKTDDALKARGPEGRKALAGEMDRLFSDLAALRAEDPAGETAQEAMARMFRFFNDSFGNVYSPDAFAGLGALYTADARFTDYLDRYGKGLASFLSKAMAVFAQKNNA